MTCLVKKVPRSKHCVVCNKCTLKFDHHCSWINACIGQSNMKYFMGYLWILTLAQFSALYLLFVYISHLPQVVTAPSYLVIVIVLFKYCSWPLSIYLLICFSGLISTLALGFQCWVVMFYGITTNEYLNRHRYEYLTDNTGKFYSPYNKGILGNIINIIQTEQ